MCSKYGLKPELLDEIIMLARKYDLEKVVLFGSRARGDHKERSDIDIAVKGGNVAGFSISADEDTSTLLEYDIVDIGANIRKELRESIENEGIVIYEKV